MQRRVTAHGVEVDPIERHPVGEAGPGAAEEVVHVDDDVEVGAVPRACGVVVALQEEPAQIDQRLGPALGGVAQLCVVQRFLDKVEGAVEHLAGHGLEVGVEAPAPLEGLRQGQARLGLGASHGE